MILIMFTEYMESVNNDYTVSMMKVKAFMEASERQYEINRMESELKVMNENGTDDDLEFLYQEAENNFGERVKDTIQKIINAFLKFMSDTKDKIISLFTSKEKKEQIDKIEKKVKLFPLLGRKKVIIEDNKKQKAVYDEHMSKLEKLKAKIKSGQDVSKDDINEVNKSFMEKHGKVIGAAAMATVTLIAAIAIHKHNANNTSKNISEEEKKGELMIRESNDMPPEVAAHYAEAVSTSIKVFINDQVRNLSENMKAIKNSIKGNIKDKKNTRTNTNHIVDMLEEGYEDNYDDQEYSMYESDDMGDDPEPEDSSDVKTEFDDPIDAIDGFDTQDNEPDTDMWDNVMDDYSGMDEDDIDDDDWEKCEGTDMDEPEDDTAEESYSESYIADLFDDIVSSVTESSNDYTPSSVVDSLINDIDNLFD